VRKDSVFYQICQLFCEEISHSKRNKSDEIAKNCKKMQFVRRENKIVRHENMPLNEIL